MPTSPSSWLYVVKELCPSLCMISILCSFAPDMQSFLMPPNYFDDGYLAIFLRQLSRRGLLLFYCSQKLTESDTPISFVEQRLWIRAKKKYTLHWLRKVWKTPSIRNIDQEKKYINLRNMYLTNFIFYNLECYKNLQPYRPVLAFFSCISIFNIVSAISYQHLFSEFGSTITICTKWNKK